MGKVSQPACIQRSWNLRDFRSTYAKGWSFKNATRLNTITIVPMPGLLVLSSGESKWKKYETWLPQAASPQLIFIEDGLDNTGACAFR